MCRPNALDEVGFISAMLPGALGPLLLGRHFFGTKVLLDGISREAGFLGKCGENLSRDVVTQ